MKSTQSYIRYLAWFVAVAVKLLTKHYAYSYRLVLMKQGTIKELMAILPQEGKLEWIGLRTERRGLITQPAEVKVLAGLGLDGDRRILGKKVDMAAKRQVTLIQFEHLAVVASVLKKDEVKADLLRRNLLVSGINLVALKDKKFIIGDVQFEGTGYCHPCSRMEEALGEGGYNAMRGHGGITARALTSGLINIGHTVKYLPEIQSKDLSKETKNTQVKATS